MIVGIQIFFSSFLLSILGLRAPPGSTPYEAPVAGGSASRSAT